MQVLRQEASGEGVGGVCGGGGGSLDGFTTALLRRVMKASFSLALDGGSAHPSAGAHQCDAPAGEK